MQLGLLLSFLSWKFGLFSFWSALGLLLCYVAFNVITCKEPTASTPKVKRRVAVVGAGLSGLVAAKELAEEGHDPVVYERSEDIGGVFNFESSSGRVWNTTTMTASRNLMEFSDFELPPGSAQFLGHKEYCQYLKSYAQHFELNRFIHTNADVLKIARSEEFSESSPRYTVKVQLKGRTTTEQFDGVVVCSGLHQTPHFPPGLDTSSFEGRVMHSSELKSAEELKGKHVVLIGGGETAADLAPEIADVAASLTISLRRGAIYAPRWVREWPGDSILMRTFHCLPSWWKVLAARWPIITMIIWGPAHLIRFRLCGKTTPLYTMWRESFLDYKGTVFSGAVTKSFRMLQPCVDGKAQRKAGIKAITKSSVVHTDGEVTKDVDVLLFCTGYSVSFPFFEDLAIPTDFRQFWRKVLVPGHPNLLFAGFSRPPLGSIPPMAEMEARFAAAYLSNQLVAPLPDKAALEAEVKREGEKHRKIFYSCSDRLTHECDYHHHLDELAQYVGCRPLFWRLILRPRLLWRIMWATTTAPQFRLFGPHAKPEQAERRVFEVPIAPMHPAPPKPGLFVFFCLYNLWSLLHQITGWDVFGVAKLG